MKNILLYLVLFLSLTGHAQTLKEGDVVFQISESSQSPLVQLATLSPWSHCGIIVMKDNRPYVLEASNVVKLTPWETWKGKGMFKSVRIKRCKQGDMGKIKYKKYLGKPYDLAFKFGNGKYYCSELVYEIYKEQYGIVLCKPQPVKNYHTIGLKEKMRQRGISQDQLVVAPSDLISSKYLQ